MSGLADADPALSAVDRVLVDWSRRIRLFYHLAPVNEAGERARLFGGGRRVQDPRFSYRPLEFSAADARRELENAPIDSIGDANLRRLYEEKCWELDRLVRLLEVRGDADFLTGSLELFGKPPLEMVRDAGELLAATKWVERRNLDVERVRRMLDAHLETYRRRYGEFDCEVVVDKAMSAKMYVHENRIHLKRGALFSREAALCDTVHEIDAHILTFLNGRRQPFRLFEIGPRGTLAFQESLGVFTEVANGVIFPGRVIALASRVVAVAAVVAGATFSEVFGQLTGDYGLDEDEAFLICVRVFRGGGLTKDWLYVAELERIFRHWAAGGDMKHLLLAKVTMDTLEEVEDLAARGGLLPARYLPEYLERVEESRSNASIRRQLKLSRIPLADLLAPLPD